VYDVESPQSFQNIRSWVNDIRKVAQFIFTLHTQCHLYSVITSPPLVAFTPQNSH